MNIEMIYGIFSAKILKKIIVLILYASETVRKLENSICFFVKLLNELKLAQMINTIAAVGK